MTAINTTYDSPGPTNPPLTIAAIAISLGGIGSQASYLAGNVFVESIFRRALFHAARATNISCCATPPPIARVARTFQFCATGAMPFTVSR
jgi:hypothetical protein